MTSSIPSPPSLNFIAYLHNHPLTYRIDSLPLSSLYWLDLTKVSVNFQLYLLGTNSLTAWPDKHPNMARKTAKYANWFHIKFMATNLKWSLIMAGTPPGSITLSCSLVASSILVFPLFKPPTPPPPSLCSEVSQHHIQPPVLKYSTFGSHPLWLLKDIAPTIVPFLLQYHQLSLLYWIVLISVQHIVLF